tara:strand:- start:644 stop:901 length:258 start_codon:yes stop_codon:yes gene_type:complete
MRVLGSEVACGTTSGAASTFGSTTDDVRLVNTGSTNRLVTITDASGNTVATFTLIAGEVTFVRKARDEKIFAANAEVRGVGVVTP